MHTRTFAIVSSVFLGFLGCGAPEDDDGRAAPGPKLAQAGSSSLFEGEQLGPEQSLFNNGYELLMQHDCNLVLYDGLDKFGCPLAWPGRAIWSSKTHGKAPPWSCYLEMQTDGNLVIYTDNRQAIWHSKTGGSGARLDMQADGNGVIYHSNRAVWSTKTNFNPGGKPRVCQEATTGAVAASAIGVVPVRDACQNFVVLFSRDGGNPHKRAGSPTGGSAPPNGEICRWATTWFDVPVGETKVCATWPTGSEKCRVVEAVGGETVIVNL